MLVRAFAIFALLFLALYIFQYFFFRNRARGNLKPARWDIAPVVGFLGAVLLALSFIEALRSNVMESWRWGLALGLIVSASIGVSVIYGWKRPAPSREPVLRAAWQLVRAFTLPLVIALFGIVISVRIIGAVLEVFLASALAIVMITLAVSMFANARRRKIEESNQ